MAAIIASSPFNAPIGLKPRQPSLMLDSNVWRYLVDGGESAIFSLKRFAREVDVQIVACPAVAYEALRTGDEKARRDLVRAVTLGSWSRLMPEAYREAGEVFAVLSRRRPEWTARNGNRSHWYKLQADWSGGGWWRRARRTPAVEASTIAVLGGRRLERAREETIELRHWAQAARLERIPFDPSNFRAGFGAATPGSQGHDVEGWRVEGAVRWWEVLKSAPTTTPRDWLDPWVNALHIVRSPASWIRVWLDEVAADEVPLNWLRACVGYAQMTQAVSSGTPVDNQIVTYLPFVEHFVTADKRLIAAVDAVRPHSPLRLAVGHRLMANAHVVRQLSELLVKLAKQRNSNGR